MPRKKKVENLPDFEKDTVTHAVINNNTTAFSNRRDQIAKFQEKEDVIKSMKDDIEELKKIVKGLSK